MTALIIEDESAAAQRLKKMIGQLDSAIEIMGEFDSIESTVDYLKRTAEPDLIFMDIHLADGSSFEIFKLTTITCPVIMITAYDEYAVRAFKTNAIDYLLKPVKLEELNDALIKYRNLYANKVPAIDYSRLAASLQPPLEEKRFVLRVGQQLKVVEMGEVAYFYTEAKITFLVTQEGKRYPIDHTLEELDEMTLSSKFFRINRQFIVQLSSIIEMHAYSKSRVKLILSPPCKLETIVSTERSPKFKRWLEGS